MLTSEDFNKGGVKHLPGLLGIEITEVSATAVRGRLPVRPELMAPNGYLHAGSVVSLADTCAGYGCVANLPPGAIGFTTIELKSNHLATVKEGTIECVATPVHLGKATQVWDSVVTDTHTGKVLALFRCTQMVLRAK
jgi:uncharacterized protein (TIGR00369 family)